LASFNFATSNGLRCGGSHDPSGLSASGVASCCPCSRPICFAARCALAGLHRASSVPVARNAADPGLPVTGNESSAPRMSCNRPPYARSAAARGSWVPDCARPRPASSN